MLERLAAQAVTDGFAAVAAGACMAMLAREAAARPLRPRLAFAFGGLCLFYAVRCLREAVPGAPLGYAPVLIVCMLPLAALLLAEGVLRRHAPRALKLLVTAGAAVMAAALVAAGGRPPTSSLGLGGYVVVSLLSILAFLLMRDRRALSRQENAAADALIAAGALLTAASVADFLPAAPIGLSGVGAAALAFILGASAASPAQARRALAETAGLALVAAAGAAALAWALGMTQPAEMARLATIFLTLLLAWSAALALLRSRGREGGAFAAALAKADTCRLESFLAALADQPLLAGLRLVEGDQLADYDAAGLATLLSARPVWTLAALADADGAARPREELADLLARSEATHAVPISRAPLRLALLTLPGAGVTRAAESDLALFGKLAAIAAEEPLCA